MTDDNHELSGPLSRGEWEAVLAQAPNGIRALLFRLAEFHGAVVPASDRRCPCCGRQPERAPEPHE